MKSFRYLAPTQIVSGPGSLESLKAHCTRLGAKPFLVTGRHSARACGALPIILEQFPNAVIFDEVDENPTTDTCDAGTAACRSQGCDSVIGVGGGSPMDAAKAIAALAIQDESCAAFLSAGQPVYKALPIAAVPTTAGTGSETTPYAVIVSSEENRKRTLQRPPALS